MRKISATYIIPGDGSLLKNGILVLEDDGTVAEIKDTGGILHEQAGLEQYSGILIPGFINVYSSLESLTLDGSLHKTRLSGSIPGFKEIFKENSCQQNEAAMEKVDFYMKHSGIVAVGDLCSTVTTLQVKQRSSIYYHTFVEAPVSNPIDFEKELTPAKYLQEQFRSAGLSATISMISPDPASVELFLKMSDKELSEDRISATDTGLFREKNRFHRDVNDATIIPFKSTPHHNISFKKLGKPILLQNLFSFIPDSCHLLLISQSGFSKKDFEALKKYEKSGNTFLVLCHNFPEISNNQLSPADFLLDDKINFCLGTGLIDKVHPTSILQIMTTLQTAIPEVTIQKLVEWACFNGAHALNIENRFGSFSKGKKPGLNLITGTDLKKLKLTSGSKLKVLHHPG